MKDKMYVCDINVKWTVNHEIKVNQYEPEIVFIKKVKKKLTKNGNIVRIVIVCVEIPFC